MVHLGESMWPVRIVEVAAAVGGVVNKGAGGAGEASGVVGIAAVTVAGGGVGVIVA